MKCKQHMKMERETVLTEYVLSLSSEVSLCIVMCVNYCCAAGDGDSFDICMCSIVLLADILMVRIHQCRHGTTGGVEIICRSWLDVSGNDVMMIISFVLSTNLFFRTTRRFFMV